MKSLRLVTSGILGFGLVMVLTFVLAGTSQARQGFNEPQSEYHFNSHRGTSAVADISQWWIEIIDSVGNVGENTSLTLDENRYPHIAYFARSTRSLRYAYQNSSGWQTTTVDSPVGQYGTWPTLALEPTTPYTAHIVYYNYDESGDLVKYARQVGASWVITTVDHGAGGLLALDSNRYPHIVYLGTACTGLKYAYQNDNGWHFETIKIGCVNGGISFALDGDDLAHLSYSHNNILKYAYQSASEWISMTVDSDASAAWSASLALEPTAPYTAHISYYKLDDWGLRYAYQSTSGWHTMTVDSDGVGAFSSMALDGEGRPHISYMDLTREDLKYAYYTSFGWQLYTIDGESRTGWEGSLRLEPTAPYTAHISYYDLTNDNLKYARGTIPRLDHYIYLPRVMAAWCDLAW